MCVLGSSGVFGWGGPVSHMREGCHRAGQTKVFPRVTPIRKVGPNDLAGRMAQKGARPRVRPIRKVAPSWASWGPVARGILRPIWAGWAHLWPSWEAFWPLGTCF